MIKNKLKKFFSNFLLFFLSLLIVFTFLNFILIKISHQNIFPRPLAATLPNVLLTLHPNTYKKESIENFNAVLGNSVAQGNGDAYLEGKVNYSITHKLHNMTKKNYLIFGRAGHHSIKSVSNLIKIHKLSNAFFLIPNLKKPNSIYFYFYEGIDLKWNYNLYMKSKLENESIEDFTLRLIKKESNPLPKDKVYNFFPILPFAGSFLEDFKSLFDDIFQSGNFKNSFSEVSDRIKKLLGFYIVLNDRKENNLTWTNSLKKHEHVKNIRPIQGAGDTLNEKQIIIGLNIFFESVKQAKQWSKTEDVNIIYISAPITIYDWNEPIVYEGQSLFPKSKRDVKSTTNGENKTKNIFIRQQIKSFSEKNNIFYIDPSDVLIKKGKSEVLHGPLDWGHLNDKGYKTVSDFIIEKKYQK